MATIDMLAVRQATTSVSTRNGRRSSPGGLPAADMTISSLSPLSLVSV